MLLGAVVACGDGGANGGGSGAGGAPLTVTVAPEFVQDAYPGVPVSVLIEVGSTDGAAVGLSASATAGEITVLPAEVAPGELAVATFVPPPVTAEQPVTVTIEARRGDVVERATREIAVVPGEDSLGPDARRILALFLPALAESHPDLGLGAEDAWTLEGQVVAPRLLVVSHYLFASSTWELGLSWHIMVAPDDWAELYLRPLGELAPTQAFRISSWSTALQTGELEVTAVPPPTEIVR